MRTLPFIIAAVIFVWTKAAEAQLGPPTVIDCSPCSTVNTIVTTNVNAAQAAIQTHVTAEMQSAAALIVNAITQSTAQISGTIDKNTAALKTLHDALIAADYQRSNDELQARLKYNHALMPGACLTTTFGNGLAGAQGFVHHSRSLLKDRDVAWNSRAGEADWSAGAAAFSLKQSADAAVARLPSGETPSIAAIIGDGQISDDKFELIDTYSRMLTNPRPQPKVSETGESDDSEAWLRREQKERGIELAQEVFNQAKSVRLGGSEDLTEWYARASRLPSPQVPKSISMLEAFDAETARRLFDPTWAASLVTSPPAAVQREQVTINALQLRMQYLQYREMETIKILLAALLSKDVLDD